MSSLILFNNIVDSISTFFSFIYNLVIADYNVVVNFLFNNSSFEFLTFTNKIVTFTFPKIEILSDVVKIAFKLVFDPLFTYGYSSINEVPFALCFLSFFIKGIFIILLIKLLKLFI